MFNEPVSEEMQELVGMRYRPKHPEQAVGSEPILVDILKEFYRKGYEIIQRHCLPEVAVVIHDQFCLEQWEDFMPKEEMIGIIRER